MRCVAHRRDGAPEVGLDLLEWPVVPAPRPARPLCPRTKAIPVSESSSTPAPVIDEATIGAAVDAALAAIAAAASTDELKQEIGRASCRERV